MRPFRDHYLDVMESLNYICSFAVKDIEQSQPVPKSGELLRKFAGALVGGCHANFLAMFSEYKVSSRNAKMLESSD